MLHREIEPRTLSVLNAFADFDVADSDSFTIQIVGTGFTGTVSFFGSLDGTNFPVLAMESRAATASGTRVVSATASGTFCLSTMGLTRVRCTLTALTGGSVSIRVNNARGV